MSITLITGPMFSGKTSELIRLAKRSTVANQRVVMFKYAKDTRYVKRKMLASSHDELTFRAIPVASLQTEEVECYSKHADVICIDEGQFIDGLVGFCTDMANRGKRVYVSGLASTFERKPFERIAELIPHIDGELIYLSAICIQCHEAAFFTKRLGQSKEVELIGGEEAYVPCCRSCWDTDIDAQTLEQRKNNIQKMKQMRYSQ